MNDKDWKEYRRLAKTDDPPQVKTRDVLDLLDDRDALRNALKQAKGVIRELKAAIQSAEAG